MGFWAKVQRHTVVRVVIAYAIVAWILLQVSAAIEPALELPTWFDTLIVMLLVFGFPLAVALAWAVDRKPPRRKLAAARARAADAEAERETNAQALARLDNARKVASLATHQEIRYCTAKDGARVAYATIGKGPPIVKTANWLSHLEYDWESPFWHHWYAGLTADHRFVRFDERGSGLSDWDVADISLEAFVGDVEAVVEATGVEKFALLGLSQGCAVAIDYAARHPERVACMILLGGFATGQVASGDPERVKQVEALAKLMEFGWGQNNPAFRQTITSLLYPGAKPEGMEWFNALQRRSASPQNAVRILNAVATFDVRGALPRVRAPTLVLHSVDDAMAPFAEGRKLAQSIPGARLVALDSPNHMPLEGDAAWPKCIAEVQAFLEEHWPGQSQM